MGFIWQGDETLSTEALDQRALQAATGFVAEGLVPGDGVGIYLRNDFAFFEASIGAAKVGAYPVAMNWHYTPAEAEYLLKDSGVKALVVHADLLEGIRSVIPEGVKILVVPVPETIQRAYGLSDEACSVNDGDTNWNVWRDAFDAVPRDPAQMPSTIIYTSGTTGHPKGVRRPMATPEQLQISRRMLGISYGFDGYEGRGHEITTAIVGPIYHSAPNAHASFCFREGASIVITPRFDPEELLALIERHRVTHLNMVPIMFNRLLKLPELVRAQYDLSSLKFVAHAAAPVSPPIKRAMIEWWGPVINEYYGSTEMGNVTFCNSEEWLAHPGSVGKPMPDAMVRVIDEAGNDLPVREIGEVIGRTKGSVDFTYQNDDEKRKRMEKEGLVTPGDMGYFDEDGFLYLCDRANDMVISGGVNIYPAEIEAELQKIAEIADCAVFGIPDEEFGESLCAYIQLQPEAEVTETELRERLRATVAGYKMPKIWAFVMDLPREDSGKIFKRKLREPYWAGQERRI
jgi:long-chain acyl-CoA synthetase